MSTQVAARTLAGLLGPEPGSGPAYRDLADRLRLLVLDGRLAHDTRLPSERELTAALGVSRTTVTRVYAELRDGGFLTSRRGSGSVIRLPHAASSTSAVVAPIGQEDGHTLAMTYAASPAPVGVGRAYEAALLGLPGLLAGTGYVPDGLPVLRERIADHYAARGLPTEPSQIVVTSGAMAALSLVARTILSRGDRVLVESPSYPHAFDALRDAGARLQPMATGESPWSHDGLVAQLRSSSPRAAYLIPDFHNPTGAVMSDEVRVDLSAQLRDADVTPIIDETMAGVNLDAASMPLPFAAHDDRAITVGSASKTYWGGLRIGWVRASKDLAMPLIHARMSADLGTAPFEQLVLSHILADPAAILADRLDSVRQQRGRLMDEVRKRLPSWRFEQPAGGLCLWVTLPERVSTSLAAAAHEHGLLLTPGPRFFAAPGVAGERHLRLPYTHDEQTLSEAVTRLAAAYAQHEARGRPRPYRDTIDLIA